MSGPLKEQEIIEFVFRLFYSNKGNVKRKHSMGLPFLLKYKHKHLEGQNFESWCSVHVCTHICAQSSLLNNRKIKAFVGQSKHDSRLKDDTQNLKCLQRKPNLFLIKV